MTTRLPPGSRTDQSINVNIATFGRLPAGAATIGIESQIRTLTEKVKTLEAQVRQAQQLETLGRAAATIAHEFNNLLTPMLAYVGSAASSDDTKLMRKALSIAERNGRMLVKMAERVLEIGAPRPTQREVVGVRQVVEAALASLCRDLSKDGISTRIEVSDESRAFCDPLHLQQVLFNLFLNAREAMAKSHGGILKVTSQDTPVEHAPDEAGAGAPCFAQRIVGDGFKEEHDPRLPGAPCFAQRNVGDGLKEDHGPRLPGAPCFAQRNVGDGLKEDHGPRLQTAQPGPPNRTVGSGVAAESRRVEIYVHNTGNAIPRELLRRLFEPFQSSKTVAPDGKSKCSGLGLALCRELIEENGGTIRVTSTPTEGTTFTLSLPATQS